MNEDVRNIVRKHLSRSPLYKPGDHVLTHVMDEGYWLGWRTTADNIPIGTTHFDVNVISGIFYVLHAEIVKADRGHGHGSQLYEIMEAIARELQCDEIRRTPSGTMIGGQTKMDYWLGKGHTRDGVEVFKILDEESLV